MRNTREERAPYNIQRFEALETLHYTRFENLDPLRFFLLRTLRLTSGKTLSAEKRKKRKKKKRNQTSQMCATCFEERGSMLVNVGFGKFNYFIVWCIAHGSQFVPAHAQRAGTMKSPRLLLSRRRHQPIRSPIMTGTGVFVFVVPVPNIDHRVPSRQKQRLHYVWRPNFATQPHAPPHPWPAVGSPLLVHVALFPSSFEVPYFVLGFPPTYLCFNPIVCPEQE